MILDNANYVVAANAAAPAVFLPLKSGLNRVSVTYGDNVTGTFTPKFTTDPENPDSMDRITEDATEIVATGTRNFMVYGPGYLGFIMASLSGGTISVQATR